MRSLILVAVVTLSGVARAQAIYRWTDYSGEVHYTNEPKEIPEEFRKAAERTEGEELCEVRAVPEPKPARKDRPGVFEAPPPASLPSHEANDNSEGDAAPRARTEAPTQDEWRKAFQTQRARIQAAQARLVQAQENTAQANSRESRAQLQQARSELAAAQRALRGLEQQAALSGVPREWRR